MDAETETINAARLIVKLCDEKLALEREVADLEERKERNEYVIEERRNLLDERRNLLDERNVLMVEKENAERDVVCLEVELEAAQREIDRLKANDCDALNLRIEELERERNEFQGALLRVKFALGWPSENIEMNEVVIKNMIGLARHYITEKNNLAFKLQQIEEIINGSDS
jgi:chromosome segregation ATPase